MSGREKTRSAVGLRRKACGTGPAWLRSKRAASSRVIREPQTEFQQQDRRLVRTIYKICSASAWREAERRGVYPGSPDDARDGFIHFSTVAQVEETARRHFAGQVGLFLVAVDADLLGDNLRWEPSRGDDLFPHLYGELDLAAVTAVMDLPLRSDGTHVFPELAP